MWKIRSRNSLHKLKGVANCTRGVFSYLTTLFDIFFHFSLICNVAKLALNVATLQRRGVPASRRCLHLAKPGLGNIATLAVTPTGTL